MRRCSKHVDDNGQTTMDEQAAETAYMISSPMSSKAKVS